MHDAGHAVSDRPIAGPVLQWRAGGGHSCAVSDFEITALVLSEHEAFRRDFGALEDAERAAELSTAWEALAARLEVHAVAEEELLYPLLARAPSTVPPKKSGPVTTTTRSGMPRPG